MRNILDGIPEEITEEIIETILSSKDIRIERIISKGYITPENFWYDQKKNEFVLLIKGEAVIVFEDNKKIKLSQGDYFNIPAHKKHRVEWTSRDLETVWLCIFYN